ncbi:MULTISPECIES: hypothetical protein [unclassified Microcoleus]|uniref:hypothetical protein n=1 Tax=unclassified Microcoleus TaxID=2642155 RepID=UPI002FD2D63C
MPTRSALCSSSRLFAVAQLHGAIHDRNTQYPILQNYQWVDRPSILYDRSLNFYPYCSAKSAIFVKGDRASKILTASDRAVGGN